jgi:hypothetical protein
LQQENHIFNFKNQNRPQFPHTLYPLQIKSLHFQPEGDNFAFKLNNSLIHKPNSPKIYIQIPIEALQESAKFISTDVTVCLHLYIRNENESDLTDEQKRKIIVNWDQSEFCL